MTNNDPTKPTMSKELADLIAEQAADDQSDQVEPENHGHNDIDDN